MTATDTPSSAMEQEMLEMRHPYEVEETGILAAMDPRDRDLAGVVLWGVVNAALAALAVRYLIRSQALAQDEASRRRRLHSDPTPGGVS